MFHSILYLLGLELASSLAANALNDTTTNISNVFAPHFTMFNASNNNQNRCEYDQT